MTFQPDPDPTTEAIAAQLRERIQLRAENLRLSRALVDAYTEVDALKAGRDAEFVKGYDQAVCEIRDHFAKDPRVEITAEIEEIWITGKRS